MTETEESEEINEHDEKDERSKSADSFKKKDRSHGAAASPSVSIASKTSSYTSLN